ncbi:MAG: CehA/McbA family metallohydrolase, partial [Deltaproteobacteria bacterium]|nr:CehA/McbA family metallohydrolase [Deltaproteobacteria bacterium]
GDVKIYNSRVRFVLQGVRDDGSFYIPEASGVLDVDIVRPAGHVGRDAIDDWAPMAGIGRLMAADTIEILDSGVASGTAHVAFEGYEMPLALITGALEAPDFIPALGLRIRTEYILPADSALLEVRTTLTGGAAPADVLPGDLVLGGFEVLDSWEPGIGLDAPGSAASRFKAYIAKDNDVAYALVAAPGATLSTGGLDLLLSAAQLAAGFGETVNVPAGGDVTYVRYYGVGPDLATITDALHAASGLPVETTSGVVAAPDGPVAGARVTVLVDGVPETVAVTAADGSFTATVPAGGTITHAVDGQGRGLWFDLPAGAGHWSPYAAESVKSAILDSWNGDPPSLPRAAGRGTNGAGLALGTPGTLVVSCPDADQFEVRLGIIEHPSLLDSRLYAARPYAQVAIGWARDGDVELTVEPGTYGLLAWRGITAETYSETITVVAGERTEIVAPLPAAYAHPGWILADPHVHGSPSSDTVIPMDERLVAMAGQGVGLHFGTDHDHVADYRPLLAPLGLDGVLGSVVADEMSPVQRGHVNLYPLTVDPTSSNGGAWPWYAEPVASTAEEFEILRERHPGALFQVNHPDSGLAEFAGWAAGAIGRADFWTDDFDAIEVLNAGTTEHLPFWTDMVLRGHRATPTGVSDSHDHLAGMIGASGTWLPIAGPAAYTDDALREAMLAGRVVVTRGPFLAVSPEPGVDLTGPSHPATVEVRAPSWIRVDAIDLVRDGVVVETVAGTSAAFTLAPDADAVYWVVARGTEPMAPLFT